MAIQRGEIYFVNLNPVEGREQAGNRPVLVLSRDAIGCRSWSPLSLAQKARTFLAIIRLTCECCRKTAACRLRQCSCAFNSAPLMRRDFQRILLANFQRKQWGV